MKKKPNILFIFPDQQRGDSLGCMGHPVVQTPNLDKIAGQGVTFTRCYTNSPLCVPARAAMQTGQYVSQNGAWNNRLVLDPDSPSYVRNIRDAGYHTAIIGKTHLWTHGIGGVTDNHTDQKKQVLEEWGFQDIHELTGPMASSGHDSPYTDYLKERDSLFAYRKYQFEYLINNYALKQTGKIPEAYEGVVKKYGITVDKDREELWFEPPWPLPEEEHYDSYVGQKTVDWLDEYKGEDPFFLMVGFPGPHDPFDSPEEYRNLYDQKSIPLGIMDAPTEPVPEYLQNLLKLSGLDRMTPEHMQEMMAAYYGKVSLIDDYIGRIVKTLEEKGMLDNTWIVYTSDHGELLGDHQLYHKMTFYEGAVHIPCIIKPAGGTSAWQCSGLTDQLDLSATMLDIAGAAPFIESDGRSLMPKILSGMDDSHAQDGKECLFSELGGLVTIMDGRYKLVVEITTREPLQLFDLESDPKELENAVNKPTLDSIQKELAVKIDDHLSANLNLEKLAKFQQDGARRY
jgi:arylsulfatase